MYVIYVGGLQCFNLVINHLGKKTIGKFSIAMHVKFNERSDSWHSNIDTKLTCKFLRQNQLMKFFFSQWIVAKCQFTRKNHTILIILIYFSPPPTPPLVYKKINQ